MAKFSDALRPNTTQRLAKEQAAFADQERQLAELRAAQAGKLLDDEPDDAVKVAERIVFAERRAAVINQRIDALRKQLKREAIDRRKQDKDASLAVLEKKLSDRAAAAARVEKAVAEFSASLAAYDNACRSAFADWSDTFPPFTFYESYSTSYMSRRIGGLLNMHSGAAPTLFADLPRRLGSLTENEVRIAASIISDIRSAAIPKPHNTDDEAA